MRVVIDIHENGWVVRSDGAFEKSSVFNSQEEYLLDVYRRTCNWHVGDKVKIIREERETQP